MMIYRVLRVDTGLIYNTYLPIHETRDSTGRQHGFTDAESPGAVVSVVGIF